MNETSLTWPQWRGPNGRANRIPLPKTLSDKSAVVWEKGLCGDGIAGVVSDGKIVIVADRNLSDTADIWRCFDATSGEERWTLEYAAPGKLDYGNSPRATPVLTEDRVYTLSAFGLIHCVERETGKILWKTSLISEFDGTMPLWGFSTSLLLVDGKLIVQPGGKLAGFVALDAATGQTLWKSSDGLMPGYASPVCATFSGCRQIVAYDEKTLVGLEPGTGERLWTLTPKFKGDFNVPTPIPLDENRIFVVTENNGARIYRFDAKGRIVPEPVAVQMELAHDSNTPVLSGNRIFAVAAGLHCLDSETLKNLWTLEDDSLNDYATLIAGSDRLLIGTYGGEILLVDISVDPGKIVSRFRPFDDSGVVLSHPAVVGNRLFIRSLGKIVCVRLSNVP